MAGVCPSVRFPAFLEDVIYWTNQAFPLLADYLQYARALFIISILCVLTGLALLLSSCRPAEGIVSSKLDLKVSILNFCSGTD